jgi:hypothetical protein
LVDRRHCRNICDVRSMKDAEIESDHFLVGAKIKLKIKRSEKTKKSEIKKWDIGKLNKKEVKEELIGEITDVQNTHLEEVEDINEMWNKAKKGINEAVGKIIGKEGRPQINSWFGEECQILLEESLQQND